METVKYLTRDFIIKLNNRAIQRNANRTLKAKFVSKLPDNCKNPIVEQLLHNDVEMRCHIAYNDKGNVCVLDIPLSDYNNLPTVDVAMNA